MIKYLLKCKDCEQEFESWFSTSDEYDRLLKLKLLNCQSCESINVEKSLMSPNLLNTKKKENLKFISYSNKIKPEIQKIYDDLGVKENIRMKSSLKFCVVAAGEYDGYVAEPRAYEWDIAAGHAILEHAGGTVTDFEGNEILYGKKDLKNPSIILKNKNIL